MFVTQSPLGFFSQGIVPFLASSPLSQCCEDDCIPLCLFVPLGYCHPTLLLCTIFIVFSLYILA